MEDADVLVSLPDAVAAARPVEDAQHRAGRLDRDGHARIVRQPDTNREYVSRWVGSLDQEEPSLPPGAEADDSRLCLDAASNRERSVTGQGADGCCRLQRSLLVTRGQIDETAHQLDVRVSNATRSCELRQRGGGRSDAEFGPEPASRLPPDGHSSTASPARAIPATATKTAREAARLIFPIYEENSTENPSAIIHPATLPAGLPAPCAVRPVQPPSALPVLDRLSPFPGLGGSPAVSCAWAADQAGSQYREA
jgi:hypothetical protein